MYDYRDLQSDSINKKAHLLALAQGFFLLLTFIPLTCHAVSIHFQGVQHQAFDKYYNEYKVQLMQPDQAIIYKILEEGDQLLTGIALVGEGGNVHWSRSIAGAGITSVGPIHTYHYSEDGLLTAISQNGRISWQTMVEDEWPSELQVIPLLQGGVYIVDYTRALYVDVHGQQQWVQPFEPFLPGGYLMDVTLFAENTLAVLLYGIGGNTTLVQLSPESNVIRHHDVLTARARFPDYRFQNDPTSDMVLFEYSEFNRYHIDGSVVDQWVADPGDGTFFYNSLTSDYIVTQDQSIMIAAEVHGSDKIRVSRFDSSGLNLWNHYADDLEGYLEWSFSPRDESGLLFMAGWADPNTLAVSRIDSSSENDSVEINSSFRTLQRDQLAGIGDIAYVVTGVAGTTDLPHLYSVNVTDSEYVQIGGVHYPYHTRLDGYLLADDLGESASIVTVGTVPSTFLSGERSYISKFGIGGTRHWTRELSGEGSFALGVVLGSQAIYAVSSGIFDAFSSAPLYVEAMDPAGNSLWVEELEEGGHSLNGISYDGNELLFFGRNEHGDMGRVAGFLYVMDDTGNVLLESHYSSAFTNETVDAIRHDDGIISLVAINEDVLHEPTHCIAIRQDADGQSMWETPLGSEYERSNCSNILKLEENRILVSSMAGSVGGLNGYIWEIDVDDGNIINTQMFAPESGSSISNLTLDLAGDCVLVAMAEVGNSESSDTKSVKCLDRQLAQRWEILDSTSGAVENLSITTGKQSAAVGFAVSSDDDSICMELIQFDFFGQEVSQPWTPADHCGPSSTLILDQTSDDFVLGGYTGTAPENGLDAISISSFSDVILRNGFE